MTMAYLFGSCGRSARGSAGSWVRAVLVQSSSPSEKERRDFLSGCCSTARDVFRDRVDFPVKAVSLSQATMGGLLRRLSRGGVRMSIQWIAHDPR